MGIFGFSSDKDKMLKAIEGKDLEKVKALVSKIEINETFPKPNSPSGITGWSFFLHACRYGSYEIVEFLKQKGSDINRLSSDGNSSVYWTVLNGMDPEALKIIAYLIQSGVSPNSADIEAGGVLPIVAATQLGNLDLLKILVDSGCDLNYKDERTPVSPLTFAADQGDLDAVSLFLKAGAKPVADNRGIPPLMIAVEKNMLDMVKILLEHGADVNYEYSTPDDTKQRALDCAYYMANEELINYLESKGAIKNQEDLYLYLFAFKNVSDAQIDVVNRVFADYSKAFSVLGIIMQEKIGDTFVIKFVSNKPFSIGSDNLHSNIANCIIDKEQFICSIICNDELFEDVESYFAALGKVSREIKKGSEKVYKLVYSNYELSESEVKYADIIPIK